jgi:hypothetical protein
VINAILLLTLLLPVPARFSLQIVIFVLFNFVTITCVLWIRIIAFFKQEKSYALLMILFLLCVTIIYKQMIILYSPVIALILSLAFYVAAFCAYEVGGFANQDSGDPWDNKWLIQKIRRSLIFSGIALGISLFREIICFGSISLPVPDGIAEMVLPFAGKFLSAYFWASTPGMVVLAALFLALAFFVQGSLGRRAVSKERFHD